MRALPIVHGHPLSGDLPHLVQTAKQIGIVYIIPIRAIEALNKRILRRATGLNVINQYSILLGPLVKLLRQKFWAVIHSDHVRQLTSYFQAVQYPNGPLSSQ